MNKENGPGTFYFHELLDRTSLALDFWCKYIHEHPSCENDKSLSKTSLLISDLIADFYQKLGQLHLDDFKK